MCLACYPGSCSRYRCLKVPPPVVFVCDQCGQFALAGEYDHTHAVSTPGGQRVCGSCAADEQ